MTGLEPNVLLRGGPPSLPSADRIRYVEDPGVKVKLPRGNGYDHFEPTHQRERRAGRDLRVFVWTCFTQIAE